MFGSMPRPRHSTRWCRASCCSRSSRMPFGTACRARPTAASSRCDAGGLMDRSSSTCATIASVFRRAGIRRRRVGWAWPTPASGSNGCISIASDSMSPTLPAAAHSRPFRFPSTRRTNEPDAFMTAIEPIRTVIVDDEPNAREGILGLLADHEGISVVGEAANGRDAVSIIRRHRPELLYLDIQMPELDGFGVLAELTPAELPVVVFVTAYDAHALHAFEVHALDYLLKPFSDERFAESLSLAMSQVRHRRAGGLVQQLAALVQDDSHDAPPPAARALPDTAVEREAAANGDAPLDRLMVRTPKGTVFIKAEDIDWIEADDYYAKLHVGGRGYLVRET